MNKLEECFVCERPVRVDRPHWMMHVVDEPAGTDLGWFPVGPECRRLVGESDGPLAYVAVERWEGR